MDGGDPEYRDKNYELFPLRIPFQILTIPTIFLNYVKKNAIILT